MAKTSLLEALNSVDASQLAEIDDRIEQLDRERESLVAARKIIDIRLNGKRERAKPQPRLHDLESDDQLRSKIHDFLSEAGRAVKPAIIGAKLNLTAIKVGKLTQHEWFEKDITGVRIA